MEASASRPIGPHGSGAPARERLWPRACPFHRLRGCSQQLRCGRGRVLRAGHATTAGDGYGNRTASPGQHPLPHHWPPRDACRRGETATHSASGGVENASYHPFPCGGWDSDLCRRGAHLGWGPGSPSRRCRGMHWANVRPPSAARDLLPPWNPGGSRPLHALKALHGFGTPGTASCVQRRAVRYLDRWRTCPTRSVRNVRRRRSRAMHWRTKPPARPRVVLAGAFRSGGGVVATSAGAGASRCVRTTRADHTDQGGDDGKGDQRPVQWLTQCLPACGDCVDTGPCRACWSPLASFRAGSR